ncbi:MAG: lytic transglycosylase domain-containing protein [Deferribacteraceae bacterium]|jgi:soluble lytic murein transglycosylase-like protein|nr:lytic transglycosylase domain-containing protein [Deferribacteraceae bacterium]
MHRICIFIFFVSLFWSTQAKEWNACYKSAAELYDVDSRLLLSIALVESGDYPYTINLGGRGYKYKDKKEALEALQTLDAEGSYDLGLMQVNSAWFRKHEVPFELGFDPCFNIRFGAYILALEIYATKGDITEAVKRYHSPYKRWQSKYIDKILRQYNILLGN